MTVSYSVCVPNTAASGLIPELCSASSFQCNANQQLLHLYSVSIRSCCICTCRRVCSKKEPTCVSLSRHLNTARHQVCISRCVSSSTGQTGKRADRQERQRSAAAEPEGNALQAQARVRLCHVGLVQRLMVADDCVLLRSCGRSCWGERCGLVAAQLAVDAMWPDDKARRDGALTLHGHAILVARVQQMVCSCIDAMWHRMLTVAARNQADHSLFVMCC